MRSATLLLLAALPVIAGCPAQGSQPAPTPTPTPTPTPEPDPGPDASPVVAQMTGFTDEICACADAACRSAVAEKVREYVVANQDALETVDAATMKPIEERFKECQASALVADFSGLTDKMCGCKDVPCAENVNKEFTLWMEANANVRGTDAQQNEAKALAERYTQCMMTAMTGGGGAVPGMGEKCGPSDVCAVGLECVKYYGIAGKKGGEFSSCERKCGKGNGGACPEGQRCAVIADGPGQVCRAN